MVIRHRLVRRWILSVAVFTLAVGPAVVWAESGGDAAPSPTGVGAAFRKVSYHESHARTPDWQRTPNRSGQGRVRLARHAAPEAIGPGSVVPGSVVHGPERIVGEEFIVGPGFNGPGGHPGDCVSCGDASCGGACGTGGCGDASCYDVTCDPCYGRCFGLLFRNMEINAGVHGFKGPTDFGRNGNFGFQEGVNLGLPLPFFLGSGIGWQLGVQGVHSNYEGDQTVGAFVDEDRNQLFTTIGIFHHATDHCAWSWGIAYDQLHDEYWEEFDLSQVRAELGFVAHNCNEFGVMATIGLDDYTGIPSTPIGEVTISPQDQYAVYVRRYLHNDGEIRGWAGLTGHGDGVLGGDFRQPLSDRFSLRANFNYILPSDDAATPALEQQQESWGIGLNLVWHTKPGSFVAAKSPFHPFFGVADNTSFMLHRD